MNLETGEGLVSFLDAKGAPSIVERAKVLFPLSQIGPITEGQRLDINNASPVRGKYDNMIDRESAFEILLADQQKAQEEQARQQAEVERQKEEAARQKAESREIEYREPRGAAKATTASKKTSKAKKTIL